MYNENKPTGVGFNERLMVQYETKKWWIFTWHKKVNSRSIGKDLVIYTKEKFENIYVNDVKL